MGREIHRDVYGGEKKPKEQLHCPLDIFTRAFPNLEAPAFTGCLLLDALSPTVLFTNYSELRSSCCQLWPPLSPISIPDSRWVLTGEGVTHKCQWMRWVGEKLCLKVPPGLVPAHSDILIQVGQVIKGSECGQHPERPLSCRVDRTRLHKPEKQKAWVPISPLPFASSHDLG